MVDEVWYNVSKVHKHIYMSINPDKLYTVKEVAELLSYHRASVWRAIRDNKIHAIKPLGQYRVLGEELIKFLEGGA